MNEDELRDCCFDRQPGRRQADLIAFVMEKYGWDEERALATLRHLDERGIAYVGVDMRLARLKANRRGYDPMAEMLRP